MPLYIGNQQYKVVTTQKASDAYDLDTYLNFYMPFGGTITLRRVGSPTVVELEYSTDGCHTWQIWEEVGTDRTLTLPAEGRMWIRNTSETSTGFSTDDSDYYKFFLSDTTFANGKIVSLLCKDTDNAKIMTDYCFVYIFYNCVSLITMPDINNIVFNGNRKCLFKEGFTYCRSLRNFVLKSSTNVLQQSFIDGIANCSSLKEAYILAPYINLQGFHRGFSSCFNLQKVVFAPTGWGSNGINGWMNGVASTGDFYCDPNLTIPTGQSGIPTGWTRHDLSELNN